MIVPMFDVLYLMVSDIYDCTNIICDFSMVRIFMLGDLDFWSGQDCSIILFILVQIL